jgi:hypothetical protein
MTATTITFTPPPCATKGEWATYADPTKLAAINFSIQNSAAAAVAFDYCVYDLAFYH